MSFLMPSVFSGSDDFQDTFSEAPDIDPDDDSEENEAELLVTNRLHQVCDDSPTYKVLQSSFFGSNITNG